MPETDSSTPNELVNRMLHLGGDCAIQLQRVQAGDHREKVLVACFRNPTGPDQLLTAVHFLCAYWIDQGLASAEGFAARLELELAGVDPHH